MSQENRQIYYEMQRKIGIQEKDRKTLWKREDDNKKKETDRVRKREETL